MSANIHREALAVRLDEKGRLTIPSSMRKALSIGPGDVVFCQQMGTVIQCAKAVNPFDVLATQAIEEYGRGETRSLRDVAGRKASRVDGNTK